MVLMNRGRKQWVLLSELPGSTPRVSNLRQLPAITLKGQYNKGAISPCTNQKLISRGEWNANSALVHRHNTSFANLQRPEAITSQWKLPFTASFYGVRERAQGEWLAGAQRAHCGAFSLSFTPSMACVIKIKIQLQQPNECCVNIDHGP